MAAKFDPRTHKTYRAIRAARELVGQSPAELAEALTIKLGEEITVDVVYNLESGRKKVSTDLLRAIAEIHGLDLDYYVYGPVNHLDS